MSTQVVKVVQGPTKVVGIPRAVGNRGPAGASAYEEWLAQGNEGTEAEFLTSLEGAPGDDGDDGREVLLRVAGGWVQWQYDGDTAWENLIALADLTGAPGDRGDDGKSVELRVAGGFIQWRQTAGAWENLVALTDITGAPGAPGDDGKSVELRVAAGAVQWRQDDGDWAVLVPLADITGPKGDAGTSPNLSIGTVTTGTPGTDAAAAISGTFPDLHLDLTIPRGADGGGGGGGGSDADTAGWINDPESATRSALDAIYARIWRGTQAQYDALPTHDPMTLYLVEA